MKRVSIVEPFVLFIGLARRGDGRNRRVCVIINLWSFLLLRLSRFAAVRRASSLSWPQR